MVSKTEVTVADFLKQRVKGSILSLTCVNCGKHFYRRRYIQNICDRGNKGRGPFCSRVCGQTGRECKEETRQKISTSQKYVSFPSRGRVGHSVSSETRQKIRLTKTGVSSKTDWDIIMTDAAARGVPRYAVMRAPIPDYIYVEGGIIVAVEIEKERWETGVRTKMNAYLEHHSKWDKVILVWYTPDNIKQKEWTLENGKWRATF